MPPRAIWVLPEEERLIEYLEGHKAEAGDGLNYKMATYNLAAREIAGLLQKGPAKTGKSVKRKWSVVRDRLLI